MKTYRTYLHIGKIGIKIAKINFNTQNILLSFFTSIIMNLLERERYKYYKNKLPLAPTYFSCGIFNIVRHCEDFNCTKLFFTPITIDEDLDNIKLLNGKPVYIDYGDFNTYRFNSLCIGYIDYK